MLPKGAETTDSFGAHRSCLSSIVRLLLLCQVKFLTKIWHPNVDYEKGDPCVDFLTESWKPDMTLRHVLQTVRGLMALPNSDMSINTAAAAELAESLDSFDKHAASETKRFATD